MKRYDELLLQWDQTPRMMVLLKVKIKKARKSVFKGTFCEIC